MTKDQVLEVGSIPKQFTAAAIIMLVEDGFVGLDEAISEYIPNLPAAWAAGRSGATCVPRASVRGRGRPGERPAKPAMTLGLSTDPSVSHPVS